jgi:Holliday junction DNA helicase RuvB
MFTNLFRLGVLNINKYKINPEEKFFENIVGYSDIKKLLFKSVVSKHPVDILLTVHQLEEFMNIVCRLLEKKFHTSPQLSFMIGDAVWNQMKSKDVRDAVRIARLGKSPSDIEWLLDVQKKYSKKG